MSYGDFFSGVSVIVAGLAALLSGVYSRRTFVYSQNAERAANVANSHAEQSNVLSANVWLDQYLSNVRLWADEACESISRAMHASKLPPPERSSEIFEALYRLSSLVDRGRWFFPNQWSDEVGIQKEPAYRGLRQPILDHLVHAYNAIKVMSVSNDDRQLEELVHLQRLFVSEVQHVLNPRRRAEEVARIDAQFAISQKLTEGGGAGK